MKMTSKKLTGLLAVLAPLFASQAFAGEIKGNLAAGFASDYEFRGALYGESLVETTLSLNTEYAGILWGASAWYGSTNNQGALDAEVDNEIDVTLSATKEFGPVTVSGGFISYNFPDGDNWNTAEFFGSASTELLAGITGTLNTYYDFDLNDGFYINPELSKSFKICDATSLNLSAGFGLFESSKASKDDGVNHYYVKAALPWQAKENLVITPYVKYVDATGGEPSDFTKVDGDLGSEHVVGGVSLSVAF